MSRTKLTALCLSLTMALAAGGCASNPARDLAMAAGVTGGEPKPAPDFVSRTRRRDLDFIPVGTSAPKRAYRSKTAAEVGGDQTELDQLKARNDAKAAAPVPPSSY